MIVKNGNARRQSFVTVGLAVAWLMILGCFAGLLMLMYRANEESHQAQVFAHMTEYRILLRGKLVSDIETLATISKALRQSDPTAVGSFWNGLVGEEEELLFEWIGFYSMSEDRFQMILPTGSVNRSLNDLPEESQKAIRNALDGSMEVSQVYYDGVLESMTLMYAVPVYDKTENLVGVLTGSRSLKTFATLLNERTPSNTEMNITWVGSDAAAYIWSPYTPIHQRIDNLLENERLTEIERQQLAELLKGSEQATVWYPGESASWPMYIQPVGVNGWSLVFWEGQRAFITPVYDALATALIVLIILLALCVGVLFFSLNSLRRANAALNRSLQYDQAGALRLESFLAEAIPFYKNGGQWYMVIITLTRYEELCAIFGYQSGETLAKHTADLIRQSLTEKEIFGRVRNCEFALLLNSARFDLLRIRLDEILALLEEDDSDAVIQYPLHYIAGVAGKGSLTGQIKTAREWYDCAGMALDRAFRGGGQQIEFFNAEMYKEYMLQRELERRSLEAVARDEFELLLLPKVDLRTGNVCGASALARWVLDDAKCLEPEKYIPLFETDERCEQLDLYLFEKLCRVMRAWLDNGLIPMPVTIRQTRRLFYRTDYSDCLENIAKKYEIPCGLLGVNLPLDVDQREIEASCGTFSSLHQKGFLLSLDDYTTALHLLEMDVVRRISEVKLRPDLLVHCPDEFRDAQEHIVKNVVDATSELGIRVVVAGVASIAPVCDTEPQGPQKFGSIYFAKQMEKPAADDY